MLKFVQADSEELVKTVRELFREYADSLGFDLCFQDFENELAGLPGEYAPPTGRLYLALEGKRPVACVGLRKISNQVSEMKRLYVRPLHRGKGIGRHLARKVIGDARKLGYQRVRLDTLPSMKRGLELYRSLGFKPIPPYRENPLEGAAFLELEL